MPLDRSRRRDLASYLRIEEPELEAGGLCRIPARDSDVRVSVRRRTAAPTRPMQREAFGWEHPRPNGRGYGARARVPAPQQGSAKVAAQT